ncbi:MAG TPA: hypothetical protein VLT33_07185 [Labilithrix sp.]|jgi:hypothetical protein|nr:hypothetical protein [Labilithrix sp.]
MITDRMTAMVLGYLVLVLTVLIDTSCFIFARPETRSSPRFALVVAITSLPLFLAGALLLRKGSTMKKEPGER